MKVIAVTYFRDLFSDSNNSGLPTYWPNLFPDLQGRLNGLNHEISLEEIKAALFSINGLKAPGPDEFSATFFHKY